MALWADINLPAIFTDHMVLQRNSEVTIWGNANPNEEIILKADFLDQEYKVKTGSSAVFKITFPTPKEGGPYTITLKGYNEVKLKNVMLGEVWLLSGQSNMEMTPAWGINNIEEEVAKAHFENIRFFTVHKGSSSFPQDNLYGEWKVCSPETMRNFSAAGYYFGQKLQEDLKGVPIGLISSAWGGSAAELWTPEEVFKTYPHLLESYHTLTPSEYYPTKAGAAYNSMIYPINDYKIAGAIWYQGETNTGNFSTYQEVLTELIGSWRKARGYEFPFYIVQIAPWETHQLSGAEIRNAQRLVSKKVANTGMIVISDTITPQDDIHPKDKKTVGLRLANLIGKNVYNTNNLLVESPEMLSVSFKKNKATVIMDYEDGLYFKSKTSSLFELAGEDGVFHPAKAIIKDRLIIVESAQVKNPSKLRYAWKNVVDTDLFNKANLPASTFTTE